MTTETKVPGAELPASRPDTVYGDRRYQVVRKTPDVRTTTRIRKFRGDLGEAIRREFKNDPTVWAVIYVDQIEGQIKCLRREA